VEGIPGDVLGPVSSLLILLPGFITLFVERALAFQREPSGVALVAKSLVYSLVTYALFALTRLPLVSWVVSDMPAGGKSLALVPEPWGAAALVTMAVGLGLVLGTIKTHDLQMKLARYLGMTSRTCREGVWLDVFDDIYARSPTKPAVAPETPRVYALVHLADGRRLNGWPEYFGDTYDPGPTLFLTNAEWVSDDERLPIPNPGILVNGSQIELIQFYVPAPEEPG
jgi:hypothetical protein